MRKRKIAGIFSVLGLAASLAFAAETPSRIEFDIAPQPLNAALQAFAEQTGMQVLRRDEDVPVQGMIAPRVAGSLSAKEALDRLLSNTGLTYEFINDRTIRLIRPSTERAVTSSASETMRFAQADTSGAAPVSTAGQAAERAAERSEGEDINEVIVTAQKREERLQDVPISISVLQGEQLDGSTVRDVTEALSRMPGVATQEEGIGANTQVIVRGVAAATPNGLGAAPTAYYLDSVPFGFVQSAFAPAADAYDLDRVELLRGPQGTLYGASALNGVVRVLTHDADLDAFEFKARGFTSNTKDGDWNYRGDMAVNVPLVEGKLAARAVLGYQDLSGWIDKPTEEDANDAQRSVARFKLNAQPNEQLSIGLSAWLSRADYGAPALGTEDRQSFSNIGEPISDDFDAYSLKVGYTFTAFSVTSMTSYVDYDSKSILDLARSPDSSLLLDANYDARTFAQEVIVNSTQQGPWRWSAGAIYRDSEDKEVFFLPPLSSTSVGSRRTSESYAAFGELTRAFLDGRWDFTAGLRYFEDKVGTQELSRLGPFTPEELLRGNDPFHATTPRVVLTWHPAEQMSLYASYSQGFRSGWLQPGSVLPSVEPDKLTNYELGSKGSLMDGRLAFDVALYYIDWQDVQQSLVVLVPGTTDVYTQGGVNGESASGIGLDFGVNAKLTDALELGANVSWNDLTVDAQVFSGGVLLFDKGDRLNYSAEYTVGIFADYSFPLGGGGYEGQFSISGNYTSELPSRGAFGDQLSILNGDPLSIVRTSFSIRAPQHWMASLFVDNLSDEEGANFKTAPGADPTGDRWARVRPRTVGVQLEYRFH